jgi:hypothetical protein
VAVAVAVALQRAVVHDRKVEEQQTSKYAVTLADLERSARVPADEQVSMQAEAPPEGPISAEELDRQRLLGITGAGRLRQS